jgi:hypothetical protein
MGELKNFFQGSSIENIKFLGYGLGGFLVAPTPPDRSPSFFKSVG